VVSPLTPEFKEFARRVRQERQRCYGELAALAGVPAANTAIFCADMEEMLWHTANATAPRNRRYKDDPALVLASQKVRDAYDAVRALSEEQRLALGFGLSSPFSPLPPEDPKQWWLTTPDAASDLLLRLVGSFTQITGLSPHFKGRAGPGRPAGTKTDWPLVEFVERLSRLIGSHGGQLICYRGTDNSLKGNIVDALELLRPHLMPELLPRKLPAEVIVQAWEGGTNPQS